MIRIKILSIISSGRKKGHTYKVISLLEEKIKQIGTENHDYIHFETIFLADYEIKHCIGCRNCMEYGEDICPIKDDIPLIKTKMKEADAVVFATPVYVGDVNSFMKALIDRLAYICHRQEFYDKCAMIVATTNATSLSRTIHTMGAATYSWGFRTIGSKGFKTFSSNDSKEAIKDRYRKEISKLAVKLYSGIIKKIHLNPSILSLASFKIQQKYHSNPELSKRIDYDYWNQLGWTDKKRRYYINVNIGVFKTFSSWILYRILSVLF